jgi:glycosyltransferase involved in cell wall biosynthesis
MFHDQSVFVVVPAYNEQGSIASTLAEMPDFVDRVVVVDDASTDETASLVEGMSARNRSIVLLQNEKNLGVGGAVRLGFQWSVEHGADLIVKMDGDGQMDPRQLVRLLTPLRSVDVDMAKGNRFRNERELAAMPKARLIGNFFLTFLTKLASGYWHVFDPQNGYIALKSTTFRRLPLDGLARGYFFENDLLVRLNIVGARVMDVPMPARYRGEKSSMSLPRIVGSFPVLLFHRLWYRIYQKYVLRDFSPIALFYGLGIPLFVWGFFFGLAVWAHSILYREVATVGTVMLAALPVIVGLQLVLQAIVLEIQGGAPRSSVNPELELSSPPLSVGDDETEGSFEWDEQRHDARVLED